MFADITVNRRGATPFVDFLGENDFEVEQIADNVISATRLGELPVYISGRAGELFFEVDLGSLEGLQSPGVLFGLLDLNTEILPVSVGVDSTNPEDPRLVLLESREVANLDENEVLSVVSALEIARHKVEDFLSKQVSA